MPDVKEAELASWLGISPTAVRDLVRRGVIKRAGRGSYPLQASVAAYAAHLRKLVSERSEGPAAIARASLLKAQQEALEIRNAKARGELLDAKAVEDAWIGLSTMLRANLFAVSTRLRGQIPHLTDTDVELIDSEIAGALASMMAEVQKEDEAQDAPV